MTNKVKPATPLPWQVKHMHNDQILNFVGPNGQDSCVFGDLQDDKSVGIFGDPDGCARDAAYIVHAANSYPRLVEALRKVLVGEFGNVPLDMMERVGGGSYWTSAAKLLRELGEIE